MQAGSYSGLAEAYGQHRPDYCPSVLNALVGLLRRPFHQVDFVDVGAGTGIWTRMVASLGPRTTAAIEPNDEMRVRGMADSARTQIQWRKGTAEQTGLDDSCCDWLTMASSFHWTEFDHAVEEFSRVLRPGGRFSALWNPRLIEVNPVLVEIEAHLDTLCAGIKRVSSGRSGMTETLTERLWETPSFDDVIYVEGRHTIDMSPARYLGAWRSVNDVQVQLGQERFEAFMTFVEQRIAGMASLEATYLTRAWSARRQ